MWEKSLLQGEAAVFTKGSITANLNTKPKLHWKRRGQGSVLVYLEDKDQLLGASE